MVAPWRIRRARAAEARLLIPLERRCITDPWSEAAFEELLRFPLAIGLLAELDTDVIGYLIARSVAGEAEVLNLAVAPERRGQGLGGALLAAGLHHLAASGARTVWLEVRESNAAAQALYTRRGFTMVGRRGRYYKNPLEDALVYRLQLDGVRDFGTTEVD